VFLYQVRVVIKENKLDEFIESLESMMDSFREEDGCLDFCFYKDLEKENTYSVIGEWDTPEAREKHFIGRNFSIMIGAARVLSENFSLNIGNLPEKGKFELAKEKINLQIKKNEK